MNLSSFGDGSDDDVVDNENNDEDDDYDIDNDNDNDNDDDIFSDEVAEFSMTFYTTVEFEEQTVDIPHYVDTVIADMNRSLIYNDRGCLLMTL